MSMRSSSSFPVHCLQPSCWLPFGRCTSGGTECICSCDDCAPQSHKDMNVFSGVDERGRPPMLLDIARPERTRVL